MQRILVLSTSKSSFIEDPMKYLTKDFEFDFVYLYGFQQILRSGWSRARIEKVLSFPAVSNWAALRKLQTSINCLLMARHMKRMKEHYDIIHGHSLYPMGKITAYLGDIFSAKTIVTGHGSDVYYLPLISKNWSNEVRNALRRIDRIVTVCQRNRDIILKNNLTSPSKLSVVYNGFDEAKFFPMKSRYLQERFHIGDEQRILLSIGRYSQEKGHEFGIKAMKSLDDCYSLVIVGNGPLRGAYNRLINRMELQNRVFLHETVDPAELAIIVNSSDIILHPSLEEGFPAVIPESLGCGKPVIATKVGGIPEAIDDTNGILIDPGSSNQIVSGVNRTNQLEFKQADIADNARTRFSYHQIARELEAIYRALSS